MKCPQGRTACRLRRGVERDDALRGMERGFHERLAETICVMINAGFLAPGEHSQIARIARCASAHIASPVNTRRIRQNGYRFSLAGDLPTALALLHPHADTDHRDTARSGSTSRPVRDVGARGGPTRFVGDDLLFRFFRRWLAWLPCGLLRKGRARPLEIPPARTASKRVFGL